MKLKEGDRVQLINEAVKATVSKPFSDKEVYVLDENGFEYRVKVNDLVRITDEDSYTNDTSTSSEKEEASNTEKSILKYFSQLRSCFFCIVPADAGHLFTTDYAIIVANNSDKTLLYSVHFADDLNGYSSFGVVEPGAEDVAGYIGNDLPVKSSRFILNYILHSDADKTGLREFSFSPEDFLNEKYFLTHELFGQHILAFDITASQEIKIPEGEIKKLVDYFSPEKKISNKGSTSVKKTKADEIPLLTNEKTVDLHIEELTDDYAGMSNSEMLNLQLDCFKKELDAAMLNHYYRIIFIHGKGNGVLRSKIRIELDAMNIKYKDADINRFGFGATEVLL